MKALSFGLSENIRHDFHAVFLGMYFKSQNHYDLGMKEKVCYSVSDMRDLTGVTRKTLFYYDRTGLLKPTCRTGVQGHKQYDADALSRLRQILMFKNAGLSLEEIHRLLDEENCPVRDIYSHALARLIAQKKQKEEEIAELQRLMAALG